MGRLAHRHRRPGARLAALACCAALAPGCAEMEGLLSPLGQPTRLGQSVMIVGIERPGSDPRIWTTPLSPGPGGVTTGMRQAPPWRTFALSPGSHLLQLGPSARYVVRMPGEARISYAGTIGADGSVRDESEAARRFVRENSRLPAPVTVLATPYPPPLDPAQRALAATAAVRVKAGLDMQPMRWLIELQRRGGPWINPALPGEDGGGPDRDPAAEVPIDDGFIFLAPFAPILVAPIIPFVAPFGLGAMGAGGSIADIARHVREERRFAGTGPDGGPGEIPAVEALTQCLDSLGSAVPAEARDATPAATPEPAPPPRGRRSASPPPNPWNASVTRLAIRRCGAAPHGLGVEVATRWTLGTADDAPELHFGRPVRFVRAEGPPGTVEPERPWELSAGPEAPCRQVAAYCGPGGAALLREDLAAAIEAARQAIVTGR